MSTEVDAKADELGLLSKQRVSEGVRKRMGNGLADEELASGDPGKRPWDFDTLGVGELVVRELLS